MLKGLEVSVVRFSEIYSNPISNRIDSEHFLKSYSENLYKIKSYCGGYSMLSTYLKKMSGGATPLGAEYAENGVMFLRVQNIMQNFFNLSDVVYITKQQDEEIKRSRLKENDVLLTITGVSYGKSAVVTRDLVGANINQHSVKMEIKDFNPYCISTFLNSKYGKAQSDKNIVGVTRPALDYESIRNFIIPNFSTDFQQKIESLVKSAHEKLSRSKLLYAQAEDTLLSELGLKDWQPKNEAVSIKSFSDFASSGRLDAEYYQSKYDELFEKLSKFPQIKIKDITNYPVSSGSTPKAGDSEYYSDEKTGIPFLRAVDIIQSRIDLNDLMYIKSRVHNGLLKRTQLHKGDVLFSIAGTVGRCGIFDYDFEANINQAIAILRFDESVVKHLYVIQFFNSKIGQLVIEKYARQGLQTNLNLEELSNLPIPILPQEIQKQIAELIQTSFALRQESKQLLESAKLAVEQEIEGEK